MAKQPVTDKALESVNQKEVIIPVAKASLPLIGIKTDYTGAIINPDKIIEEYPVKKIEVYDDMMRDSQVYSVVQTRFLSILNLTQTWTSDNDAMVEDIKARLGGIYNWELVKLQALSAETHGYAIFEVIATPDGRGIKELAFIPQKFSTFHKDMENVLIKEKDKIEMHKFPRSQFWILTYGNGIYGSSILSAAWFDWGGKKQQEINLATVAAKNAVAPQMFKITEGTALAFAQGEEQEKGMQKLANQVAQIDSASSVVLPYGLEKILSEGADSGAITTILNTIEYHNKQIAKAILGQSASSEGTSGRLGNEDLQESVMNQIIAADGDWFAGCIQQLIDLLVRVNYGEAAESPKFTMVSEDKISSKAKAINTNAIIQFLNAGAKLDPRQVEEMTGGIIIDFSGDGAFSKPEPTQIMPQIPKPENKEQKKPLPDNEVNTLTAAKKKMTKADREEIAARNRREAQARQRKIDELSIAMLEASKKSGLKKLNDYFTKRASGAGSLAALQGLTIPENILASIDSDMQKTLIAAFGYGRERAYRSAQEALRRAQGRGDDILTLSASESPIRSLQAAKSDTEFVIDFAGVDWADISPQQAIDYLDKISSNPMTDVEKDQLARAVAYAGGIAASDIEDKIGAGFKGLMTDTVKQSYTLKDFKDKAFPSWLENSGIALARPYLAETLWRTYTATAFSEGNANVIENDPFVSSIFPAYEYVALLDDRTAPQDRILAESLRGKAISVNDPLLAQVRPPRHWQCRCDLLPVDKWELQDGGYDVQPVELIPAMKYKEPMVKPFSGSTIGSQGHIEKPVIQAPIKLEPSKITKPIEPVNPLPAAAKAQKEIKQLKKEIAETKKKIDDLAKPVKLVEPERVKVKDFKSGSEITKKAFDAMPENERNMLLQYTGGLYSNINNSLRKGINRPDFDVLSNAIKKLPAYKGDVYRGITFISKSDFDAMKLQLNKSGETWGDKAFLSTTIDKSIMQLYSSDAEYSIQMTIKSKNGSVINGVSAFSREQEILFDKGHNFIVKSSKTVIDEKTGTETLYVELEDLE